MCGYPAMMPNSQSDFMLPTDISNVMCIRGEILYANMLKTVILYTNCIQHINSVGIKTNFDACFDEKYLATISFKGPKKDFLKND